MRGDKDAIARRVAEIGQTLTRDFPAFASVANPEPATVEEAQKNPRVRTKPSFSLRFSAIRR